MSALLPFRLPVLLALAGLLLSGCASFQSSIEPKRTTKGVQRFFVVTNLNDNHALDHQIAASLKARGRSVELGPLTMMPDDTQAVVTYQDQWTWDFKNNLVYLNIAVRDPLARQPYATATFGAKVPLRDPVPAIVDRLVADLLAR
jgi:uncharacterized protein YceK